MTWILLIAITICATIVLFLIIRNRLIASENLVDASFADIDAQLLKRYELIPKLIQVASGYAKHEAEILQKVAKERGNIQDKNLALSQILNEINVIKENYPDLKADSSFDKLMSQIKETENQLLYARQFYNGTVEEYNRLIAQIPYSFFCSMLGHKKKNYVDVDQTVHTIPKL